MKYTLSLLAAGALIASVGTASAAPWSDMMATMQAKMDEAAARNAAYNDCIKSNVDMSLVKSGGEIMSRTKANMAAIAECNKSSI